MAITGRQPMKKWQAAIEAVPGTILPATRVQPMLGGSLVQVIETEFPAEERGSFIKNYGNHYQTARRVELQGLTAVPTYEDLPWFLQTVAKGGVTGSPTLVTAYNYVFSPTVAVDDLKTVNWEVANDTQNFSVPFGIGTRFRLEGGRGKASVMTMDYMGQRAVGQAITSNLSLRTTEAINLATATVMIDSSTVGSTAVTNVLDFNFELQSGQKQFSALDGNLYPRDAYRGETRAATIEMTLAFTDTTEYTAFVAGTTRKIRLNVDGSVIAGSTGSAPKRLTIDWYGPWTEAPMSEEDGLVVIKVKGESVYDSASGGDWKITVRNDLSALV